MKKYLGILTCCCFLLAFPALSLAASGWYGSINIGGAWLADQDWDMDGEFLGEAEWDTGYTVGAALGYMMDAFRVEGEIAYQTNDQGPHRAMSPLLTVPLVGSYDEVTGQKSIAAKGPTVGFCGFASESPSGPKEYIIQSIRTPSAE